MWIGAGEGVIIMMMVVVRSSELAYLLTAFLNYIINFGKAYVPDYDPDTSKESKRLLHYINCVLSYQTILGIGFCFHFFIFPHSPIHVTSEIEPIHFHPVLYWFYGLLVSWIMLSIFWTFGLCYVMLLFYLTYFVPIFSFEFCLGQNVHQRKSSELLRTIQHFSVKYRSVELLIQMQNLSTSFIFIPMQFAVIYHVCFCSLVIIRYWEKFNATPIVVVGVFACGIMTVWGITMKMFGKMSTRNRKTKQTWKHGGGTLWKRKDRMYMKRFQMSCRPLSISYGNYFIIKPASVLRYLMKISSGTFKALLLSRKF
ncbi:unnamed protein product [Orchesella dallaii]|uniref:Uncharacterized protein n=1 Tax=Orchesella dallaii TaxID=48710 RepID=A0ABP1PP77_9HEXA